MNLNFNLRVSLFVLFLSVSIGADTICASGLVDDHADRLESQLQLAAENAAELAKALDDVPSEQEEGMQFLIANMPTKDLMSLGSDFLLENVRLGYEARKEAKWGDRIPESVFLNEILPYSSIDEQRDNVRAKLRAKFWPQIQELDDISLAAARLNKLVFQQLSVKYSTKRRVANQGAQETMETGIASCTGLSILLIDACRACGIPARFVGVPMWTNNSGNHSWVEVWDDGWHYTGAAEPTGDNLNRGWFTGRASGQKVGDRRYGIYATSFKKTDTVFPMAWSRRRQAGDEIYGVEVTSRYKQNAPKLPEGFVELQFKTLAPAGPDRCRANLLIRDQEGTVVFRGKTHDESFDMNDHLTAQLKKGKYELELKTSDGKLRKQFVAETRDKPITLRVVEGPSEPATELLKKELEKASATLEEVAKMELASTGLSKEEAAEAKKLLVDFHQSKMRKERKAEHEAKVIRQGDLEMKFAYTVFGDRPESGRSLYISMHGGGGAPAALNDGQWRNQQRLYKLDEGVYVAPRAPTNTWNLWHQGHIDPMFTRLIENMILFEDVNPDRVYITGYSAGGDGVFQLAPRMADQLAAAAMMAGHPNETAPDGLRNLPFTLHMGANDSAYNRNKKAADWKKMLAELREKDPQGYEHWVEIHAGKGHWMDRQDAKGVEWLGKFTRGRAPEKVVWVQDDVTHSRFYWLAVSKGQEKGRSRIVATREGNQFQIEDSNLEGFSILLDDDFVDLDAAIVVQLGDSESISGKVNRTIATLIETLVDRGDPRAVYAAKMEIQIPEK
ncbi:MAG: transglutaminase domain-containing protein [Planctomycetota bacterium]